MLDPHEEIMRIHGLNPEKEGNRVRLLDFFIQELYEMRHHHFAHDHGYRDADYEILASPHVFNFLLSLDGRFRAHVSYVPSDKRVLAVPFGAFELHRDDTLDVPFSLVGKRKHLRHMTPELYRRARSLELHYGEMDALEQELADMFLGNGAKDT